MLEKDQVDEEQLIDLALEAGAEDVKEEETEFEVVTVPSDFEAVKKAIDDAGLPCTLPKSPKFPRIRLKWKAKKPSR